MQSMRTSRLLASHTFLNLSQKATPHEVHRTWKLEIGIPGLLDSLLFVDDSEAAEPVGPDDVEIEIRASGLDLRDVMISFEYLIGNHLGLESSSVITKIGSSVSHLEVGERVWHGNLETSATMFKSRQLSPAYHPW